MDVEKLLQLECFLGLIKPSNGEILIDEKILKI